MTTTDDPETEGEVKKTKKRFMFLGYSPGGAFGSRPGLVEGGIARNPSIIAVIFERLGWKKVHRHRSEGEE
jgi:hypothetical protein